MSTLPQAPSADSVDLGSSLTRRLLRSVSPAEVEQLRELFGEFQEVCDLALARQQAARPPGEGSSPPTTWTEVGERVARLLEHLSAADAEAARRAGELLLRGLRLYLGTLGSGAAASQAEAPAGFDEGRILRETFLVHVTAEEAESLRRVGRWVLPMALEGTAGGGPGRVGPYLRAAMEDLRHTARYLEWLAQGAGEGASEGAEELRAVARAADLSGEILKIADRLAELIPAGAAAAAPVEGRMEG